jgi:hypothetical protein
LHWLQNNLSRIAGIQYFSKRIALEEVLPPVLLLLKEAYSLRYLLDHGNFKKSLNSMKTVSRDSVRIEVPVEALWDYYSYLKVFSPDKIFGQSITDYYWAEEEELPLAKPMSHKYGYVEYKNLLLSNHIWKGFESSYFDLSGLNITYEMLSLMKKDSEKFLRKYVYPLPVNISSPTIEVTVNSRLVAAHKIARLIEIGEEAYIGDFCFQMKDTVSYMGIVKQLLNDSSFVEESLPLRTENRGLFSELDYNVV